MADLESGSWAETQRAKRISGNAGETADAYPLLPDLPSFSVEPHRTAAALFAISERRSFESLAKPFGTRFFPPRLPISARYLLTADFLALLCFTFIQ